MSSLSNIMESKRSWMGLACVSVLLLAPFGCGDDRGGLSGSGGESGSGTAGTGDGDGDGDTTGDGDTGGPWGLWGCL